MKEHFKKVFPCEPQVSFYADYMFGVVLEYGSWLTLLGADVSDGIDVVFSGNKETKHFDMTDEPPERKQLELCSYKIDKEDSLGIFTLNRCEMSAEYTDRLSEFFSAVRDNNIGNIAVDLRSNGGGTKMVCAIGNANGEIYQFDHLRFPLRHILCDYKFRQVVILQFRIHEKFRFHACHRAASL